MRILCVYTLRPLQHLFFFRAESRTGKVLSSVTDGHSIHGTHNIKCHFYSSHVNNLQWTISSLSLHLSVCIWFSASWNTNDESDFTKRLFLLFLPCDPSLEIWAMLYFYNLCFTTLHLVCMFSIVFLLDCACMCPGVVRWLGWVHHSVLLPHTLFALGWM